MSDNEFFVPFKGQKVCVRKDSRWAYTASSGKKGVWRVVRWLELAASIHVELENVETKAPKSMKAYSLVAHYKEVIEEPKASPAPAVVSFEERREHRDHEKRIAALEKARLQGDRFNAGLTAEQEAKVTLRLQEGGAGVATDVVAMLLSFGKSLYILKQLWQEACLRHPEWDELASAAGIRDMVAFLCSDRVKRMALGEVV